MKNSYSITLVIKHSLGMYKQTPILQTLLQFVYLRFKFYRSLFLFV